ncbi:MAG: glycosyltransferase family 2 protein [Synergistaceae bacterium]|jgi:glycosyltransferase involved in cell wall biosynthesis|nr:glycosyltransferase family 2 protein [Synergistaceae bacterium]
MFGAKEQYLISFVVPVYNRVELVQRCVDSILSAGDERVEVIIVDDASTDGTPAVCRSYAARHGNVRFVQMPLNGGPGVARNAGMTIAKGEFIFFVDSDDTVATENLARLLGELESHRDADIVVGKTEWEPPLTPAPSVSAIDNAEYSDAPEHEVWRNGNVVSLCSLYKRKFLEENGIRFARPRLGEDVLFILTSRLFLGTLYLLPFTIYRYNNDRGHPHFLSIEAYENSSEVQIKYMRIHYTELLPKAKLRWQKYVLDAYLLLELLYRQMYFTVPVPLLTSHREYMFISKDGVWSDYFIRNGFSEWAAQWLYNLKIKLYALSVGFSKNIFIFPASGWGRNLALFIRRAGWDMTVKGFLDNNPSSHLALEVNEMGYCLKKPAEFDPSKEIAIVIHGDPRVAASMEKQLEHHGGVKNVSFINAMDTESKDGFNFE